MWDAKTNLWYLGISTFGTVCVAGYLNYKINQWIDKRINQKKKANKIDILRQNRMLAFGPSRQQCDGHMNREFDCGNLDCNYGRLSYILGYINNCKKSLDVCIYIITAKLFGDCIIKAQQRGVIVRVITDSGMSFSAQSLINTFRLAGIVSDLNNFYSTRSII